jgi:tetratricopeptide (TPR) repeat protein
MFSNLFSKLSQRKAAKVGKAGSLLFIACLLSNSLSSSQAFAESPLGRTLISDASNHNQIAYLTPSLATQTLRAQASANYQAMQFQTALEQYKSICQSSSASANDYYWLGESLLHLDRFAEASQALEQAITLNPKADSVRVRLVQSYVACNQPQTAQSKCSEALGLVSDPVVRKQISDLNQFCSARPSFHINKVTELHAGARTAEK